MSAVDLDEVVEKVEGVLIRQKSQQSYSEKQKDGDLITREDFDGVPVSLDEIEDGLWLGNLPAASNLKILVKYKITHVLTLDSCPLPRRITELSHIKTKFIQIADMAKEDIISHFESCCTFIAEGLQQGAALVHCYAGVSRSSTIVIAYTMKKYNMPYMEAFERVRAKRRFVLPNSGFVHQLKLYETMGFTIDKTNPKYRDFRLKIAADQVKKVKILPRNSVDLIKPDPSLTQVKPEPIVYRCKKCRRILASHSNIITHLDREAQIKYKILEKQKSKEVMIDVPEMAEENGDTDEKPDICVKTYFVEPIAWMKNICHSTQGKLYCPKCNNKVGSFSWIMGCQCPCGAKVSPAFYLVPSKVEWSNVVQNVQVTV